MSKLVDKERLAKLAQGLYDKLHAEVQAEKTRAEGAEAKVLKDAKDYTDEKIVEVNSDNSKLAERVGSLESFKTAQVKDNADQLALINGKVSQDDYDDKMELLDQKDIDLQAAINAEKTRAEGIEGGLDDRIKDIEDDYLKAADKTELQGNINKKVDQTAYNAKVQEIAGAIEALEAQDGVLDAAIKAEVQRADAAEKVNAKAIADEKSRAEGKEGELLQAINKEVQDRKDAIVGVQGEIEEVDGKVEKNKTDIAGHNTRIGNLESKFGEGQGTVEDQIAAAIAKEVKDRDDAILVETNRAKGIEQGLAGRLEVIEGEGEGSINKAVADLKAIHDSEMGAVEARVEANENKLAGLEKATVKAEIEQAEADAKAYADQKITALVDSAPDAMNTLNELAKAINDNKSVYDTYVEQHATAMATMKSDLQAEIDSDVLVEKNRAEAAEKAIENAYKAADTALHTTISKEIDDDVKVEKDRAMGEEAKIREEFAEAVKTEKERAEGVEAAIRGEFAAADATLKSDLQKEIDDDVKAEETRAKGVEADLLAAINKEIQDRKDAVDGEKTLRETEEGKIRAEFAAADEALHATIKGEIGSIVGSLNLSIVNDEVVLKLGGTVDGIALTSVKLDMASDKDIDEIINKLGVEEE